MAVPVILNFDTSYSIEKATDDLKNGFFTTELQEGGKEILKIEISKAPHELMPGVYNLGFGPLTEDGRINDKAELPHRDYSRVFSTILFVGHRYMVKNPDHMLGIDGSDNRRAVLYFRMLQRNYDYLNNYFEIFGLKYYVRMTRFGKRQYDNPFDFTDVLPSPEKIIRNMRIRLEWLYNYFNSAYMESTLEKKIREFDEVAKRNEAKPGRPLRPGQSSLHDIIRTPEQAERFMRLMKFAAENPPKS